MATPNRHQIYKKTAINLVSEFNSQARECGLRLSNNILKKSNFLAIIGVVNVAIYVLLHTVFPYIYVLYLVFKINLIVHIVIFHLCS